MEKKVPNIRNYKLIIYLISIVLFFLLGYSYGVFKNEKLSKEKLAKIFYEEPALFSDVFLKMQELKKNNDNAKTSKIILDLKESLMKDNDFFLGNPKGEKVIIEFFDYNCGYCKKSLDAVTELLRTEYDLKISFRDYPILSPSSRVAAKAALASREQGKYFKFHSALMSVQGNLNKDIIFSIATNLNIDIDKLKKDMKKIEVEEIIEQNESLARKLNIRGTPTFIIDGKIYAGALELNKLREIINKSLSDS